MKILLDESVPRKLAFDFPKEHEVKTVRDMNWLGNRNGDLLKLMTENNFELFITVDRNLPYQQNLQSVTVPIAFCVELTTREKDYDCLFLNCFFVCCKRRRQIFLKSPKFNLPAAHMPLCAMCGGMLLRQLLCITRACVPAEVTI